MPGLDAYTKLLLHCNGDDGSTTVTDSSSNGYTISVTGGAQIDTAFSKFGGSSLLLDTAGDYLTVPDSADWNFSNGDFTIDFWTQLKTVGLISAFFCQYVNSTSYIIFDLNSENKPEIFCISGGTVLVSLKANTALVTDTLYHLAYVRYGSNAKIFINGTSQELTVSTDFGTNTLPNFAADLVIGANPSNTSRRVDGWMDEIRISKGIARWTSDFTPPTEEYAALIATSPFKAYLL